VAVKLQVEKSEMVFMFPIERIVDEAMEHRINMQTTKKGDQLFENVENSVVLQ
jgi:hypothetical protein